MLVQCHKQLTGISGAFHVTNPSTAVLTLLDMTRLTDILVDRTASEDAPTETGVQRRSIVRDGLVARVHDFDDAPPLVCRAIGDGARRGRPDADDLPQPSAKSLLRSPSASGPSAPDSTIAAPVSASCWQSEAPPSTSRATAPTWRITWWRTGRSAVTCTLLHGLVCEGGFRRLITFEATSIEAPIGLSTLVRLVLDETGGIGRGAGDGGRSVRAGRRGDPPLAGRARPSMATIWRFRRFARTCRSRRSRPTCRASRSSAAS